MRLRASGVKYDGIVHDSMSPESLDRERKGRYWIEVRSGDTVFFPAHLTASYQEGLGTYRMGADTWNRYAMFRLAVAAGWYTPLADEETFPDAINGVALGAGRVWMGTAGLGIVARDLHDGTWSRFDVKTGVLPGIHSGVLHADNDYLFGHLVGPSGDWKARLPDVRQRDLGPALEVYSARRNTWLRIRGIPRNDVMEFGWTNSSAVSLSCDTRGYARTAVMPLDFCTMPEHADAAPARGGYILGREFDEPGAPLRYVIRKDRLEAAFDSVR